VLLYSYQRTWEAIVPTLEEKFNDGMNVLLSPDRFGDGLPHHSPNLTSIIKKDQMNSLIPYLYAKFQSLKMNLYARFQH
jgi:hypothetical protein